MKIIVRKFQKSIKWIIIYINLVLFPLLNFAQNDEIVFKKVFYNEKLIITDSINSVFTGYDLFQNNKSVYYLRVKPKQNEDIRLQTKIELTKGKPILLNDTLIWNMYNKKGRLFYIETRFYKDGYPIIWLTKNVGNFENDEYATEVVDFSKQYMNQKGSYYGYVIKGFANGQIGNRYWFYYNGKKWKCKKIR